jgi:hypothetical protein
MLEADAFENPSTSYRHHALLAATPLFLFGILVGGITLFLLAMGGPSQAASVVRGSFRHNLALVIGVR